jgi:hypothetical protein
VRSRIRMFTMIYEDRRRAWIRAIACPMLAAGLVLLEGCTGSLQSHLQPPSVPGKPYIRMSGQVDGFNVWVVDGCYVREKLDEEFTNFGQHYEFPVIPAAEFWLDEENSPGEQKFFIDHLLIEYRLMAGGMDYDRALDEADKAEKAERLATPAGRDGSALLAGHRREELVARVHKQVLDEGRGGVKVWVVDGELVRDVFFIDFTEGGHDWVYDFVPAGEVWIDDDVRPEERRFILLHELHERALMSSGWAYGRAHRDSSRIESHYRRHPRGLDGALRVEIEKNRLVKSRR